jgi:hypothetical protein
MPMKQPKTDYGEKGETGEHEPKGAKSSDSGGERKGKVTNGIGLGKADATGRSNGGHEKGEYNTGRSESTCYNHEKKGY